MKTSIHRSLVQGLVAWVAGTTLCAAQNSAPLPTPTNPAVTSLPKAAETAAKAQETPKFLRYVRAAANGAKVRNIFDAQGVVVLDAPAQTLFTVYDERGPWLEVEAAGGVSVWVYGRYVAPTSAAGVLQITGSEVHMRPLPSSGPESLPLRQQLGAGQRVVLKARKDLSKPLGEDWVNIWSPPGARAWVAAAETESLPAGIDGSALWAAAVTEARKLTASVVATEDPKLGSSGADTAKLDSKDVSKALAEAEKLLTVERNKEAQGVTPDYSAARAAFEGVLALKPSAATADLVRGRVELCKGYAEGFVLRGDLEQQRQALDAALRKRQDEMDKAAKRGVFEGRFDVRGTLERVDMQGESHPLYFVRWAGEASAELVCTTGRFDLDDYVGSEIGIVGRELRGVIRGTTAALTRPREIDIARIEIIAARKTTK